jgi:hypothetical protein
VNHLKIKISINKSKVPYEEMMDACRKDAPLFNEMALEWKIWLVNKEEGLIGGIYYFEDEEAYKKSMKPKREKAHLPPLIENVFSQVFDVNEDLSKINKAPI